MNGDGGRPVRENEAPTEPPAWIQSNPDDGASYTVSFLRALYPNTTPGLMMVSCDGHVPLVDVKPFWTGEWTDFNEIAKQAVRRAESRNVWMNVCMRGPVAAGKRGSAENVFALPGVWADVDFKLLDSDRDVAIEKADKLLDSFPIVPSIVVASGNGYHPYWLLDKAWEWSFDDDPARQRADAKSLVFSFNTLLNEMAKAVGGQVDMSSAELARMLRLPGTWNRKLENPNGPVLVTFEDCGRRYTVEELRELVPSARPPISTPKAVVAPSAHAYTPDEWAQLGYEQIPRLGGRNNAGYWLASQLRDDRYDSETCWSAMQQYHRLAEGWPADHRYTIAEAQASLQSALNGEPRDPHPRAFLHAEGVDWADKSDAKQLPTRLVDGAEFVFQESDMVASVWGDGSQVLWASGEGCMIDAQQGLGKTTLAQQLVLARIGVRPASLLGFPVATDDRPVLYLAMDRPRQAARSLRRMVGEVNRELLRERLRVWRGPLPFNLLQDFRKLANFVDDVGAGLVAIDSVKDLAPGLSKDEVGSGINQAWQEVIARGVELLALHHQRKDQQGTAKKHALSDVYGSEWLTAGLGSVLVLVGSPGGEVVELRQLKMPVDEVGPLHLLHDHATGTTRLTGDFPKLRDVLALHPQGLTVKALAEVCRLNEKVVQRQLASLEKQGLAERSEGGHTARGRDPDLWRLTPQGRWAADQKP